MKNKVLFVEDEEDLALIVADTLRGLGYEVVTAADGVDGLEKFKSCGADIIVADVMMPLTDGFSMAREIRKLSPTVPLLFLTAKSTIEDVEKGFEIGADDYLKKPFELRELIVRIRALLRRYGADSNADIRHTIGAYTFNVTTQILSIGDKSAELSYFEARILEQLAARGGLGWVEIVWILLDKRWGGPPNPPEDVARSAVLKYVAAWEAEQKKGG